MNSSFSVPRFQQYVLSFTFCSRAIYQILQGIFVSCYHHSVDSIGKLLTFALLVYPFLISLNSRGTKKRYRVAGPTFA